MNDCLFCKIIKKEIPSKIIFEDDQVLVFLDIKPTTNGDTLIVPKTHLENILEADKDILFHMNTIYQKLYKLYQDKLHCEGLTLSTNIDYGQDIKHFHMHFIPRYKNDKISHLSNKDILKDINEIEKIINS